MDARSIIARRLREARTKKDLSQKKLGVLAGIDEFAASPRINQYERGKHEPDVNTLERVGRVLQVPVAYFFAKDNDLAQLLLLWGKMTRRQRQAVLKLALADSVSEPSKL
jgi:transcriptional regulator with XRE-family HTH domain